MPELPEVEVVRAGLVPVVTDATIAGVDVRDTRALTRHRARDPRAGASRDFAARLEGRRIIGAARRGKFLWLPLGPAPHGGLVGAVGEHERGAADAPAEAVLVHLGMSGQMLLRAPAAPTERHERIRFSLDRGARGAVDILFADQRTFGSLAIDPMVMTTDARIAGWGADGPQLPRQVRHIARDPLDGAFEEHDFVEMLARKNSAIKRVLLDQSVVSGVGNIYADEALWAARIHPETVARALSSRAVLRLLAQTRAVLNRALAEGGTSFDAQYVNVNGQAGYFARSLNAYGRAGAPCPRCGRPIARVPFGGRSSHFCARCQRRR